MRKLSVFNQVSLDGYICDARGDMSWAHPARPDPEWNAFVAGNARGGATLLFGRVTYDLMAGYWPTPQAARNDPVVASRMNAAPKVVFSRTLKNAAWANTMLVTGDIAGVVRGMKRESGPGMVILGSGTIVAQLAPEGVIDSYQIVVIPIALGAGRTMFEGLEKRLSLKLTQSRAFANGNVVLTYEPGT
jgi:dihydrofolate reductase